MTKITLKYAKHTIYNSEKQMPKKLSTQNPSPHERLFKSTTARIIDHFLTFDNYEYSKTEIAQATETSLRTIIRELPTLEKYEIIKHTRTIGQAEMYQTNKNNPIIEHLKKVTLMIATIDVDKELQNQKQQTQTTTANVQNPVEIPT